MGEPFGVSLQGASTQVKWGLIEEAQRSRGRRGPSRRKHYLRAPALAASAGEFGRRIVHHELLAVLTTNLGDCTLGAPLGLNEL